MFGDLSCPAVASLCLHGTYIPQLHDWLAFCALLVSCQCSDSVNKQYVALKCIIQFREASSLYYSDIARCLPLLLNHIYIHWLWREQHHPTRNHVQVQGILYVVQYSWYWTSIHMHSELHARVMHACSSEGSENHSWQVHSLIMNLVELCMISILKGIIPFLQESMNSYWILL